MIIDTYEDSKNFYETDICIVGSGAAGTTIAKELSNTNLDILVLETGGNELEPEIEELSEGKIDYSDEGLSYVLTTTRLRMLGGTTNIWSGCSAPFTELDMQNREWIPYSGWPIARKELDSYYIRAHELLPLGNYDYDADYHQKTYEKKLIPFDGTKGIIHKLFRYSNPPLRFKEIALELKNHPRVTFLLHAHCVDFDTDENDRVVNSVDVTNFRGWKGNVKAKTFIIAAGGIDNAKVLLNTEKDGKPAIGNRNDQVGRYFMEHPHITCAFITGTNNNEWAKDYIQHHVNEKTGKKKSSAFWFSVGPSDDAQREHKIANFGASFDRVSDEKKEKHKFPSFANYDFFKTLDNSPKITNNISGLNPESAQMAMIYCRMEQSPNPNSRVYLSDEKDALGLRKVALHWHMTELDKRTAKISTKLIAEEVGRLSYGRVKLADWQVDNSPWNKVPPLWACHHMGTTRMGNNKKTSVVDANCKVHDVENLYVAGASVFPTSSYVNPTLNLTTLAIRLADHLKTIKM